MSFLSEVKGWSPVIHSLARQSEVGLVTAAVYGAVWRYCQMENRVCTASARTIAEDLGIDHATTLRHIKKLCDLGYLKDETPGLRNAPHTYSDTGKVKIAGTIEATTGAERTTTGAERTTTGAERTTTGAERTTTGAESRLNRVFNRVFKESESHTPDKILKQHRELGIRLTQICGYDGPEFVINSRLRDCAEATEQLAGWGATVDLLDQFKAWWWGKTPPTFKQVIEEWGKFLAGRDQSDQADYRPALDADKLAAYKQRLEADRAAEAESAARVSEIMGQAHTFGIDVQQQIKKTIRRIKK